MLREIDNQTISILARESENFLSKRNHLQLLEMKIGSSGEF